MLVGMCVCECGCVFEFGGIYCVVFWGDWCGGCGVCVCLVEDCDGCGVLVFWSECVVDFFGVFGLRICFGVFWCGVWGCGGCGCVVCVDVVFEGDVVGGCGIFCVVDGGVVWDGCGVCGVWVVYVVVVVGGVVGVVVGSVVCGVCGVGGLV